MSFREAFLEGAFTVPGDGCIDYKPLFDVLKQKNYSGLCNAIMMAAPKCEFIKIWQEKYEDHFKPRGWNESSIRLPYILANQYPHLITVLPPECFFLPNWNETDNPAYKLFLGADFN